MLAWVDNILNKITMYRLVLYYVACLWAVGFVFSFAGLVPFRPFALVFSTTLLVCVSVLTNAFFAHVLRVPANAESVYITALILALIITPSDAYLSFAPFACIAAFSAMASKYIIAVRRALIFNPAAFAAAFTAFTINQSASWWIGAGALLPFVACGGLLVARKMQRFDLLMSFFCAALLTILAPHALNGSNLFAVVKKALVDSPLVFFAFVMLTEPLTAPSTRMRQAWYGGVVGFLFAPFLHIGALYSTPELALLAGNLFSYAVSPKKRYVLMLREKTQIARDMYDFIFQSDRTVSFVPGQYLEWTLADAHPDARGNRRYFTIASSPTEEEIRIGIKFYSKSSTFKRMLLAMKPGDTAHASQCAGDFVLPKDTKQKLVFVAGGIGITPFRSMIAYLMDQHEQRDIVLLYSNKRPEDAAYKEVYEEARRRFGLKTVLAFTDSLVRDSGGYTGHFTGDSIKKEIPDFKERLFYVSGPRGMVKGLEDALRQIGIDKERIKTDFFPGFA